MSAAEGDSYSKTEDGPQTVGLPMLVARLKAAGETTRLRLLKLLAEGELTVTELTQILGQSQPRVSRHLKLLVEAGLIERLPEGSWVFYRLAEGHEAGAGAGFVRRLLAGLKSEDPRLIADQLRRAEVTAARGEAAARYFAENAAGWDRLRTLYIPEAEVEAQILALLEPKPDEPQPDLLVDLGTGTGRVLEILAPLFKRAIGFDINHPMLSVARVNLERAGVRNAHVRHSDLLAVPLAPGSASAVVLHQVLHYLDNPAAAVAAAARLLAPGGRLLIADFAPHTLEELRNEHAHRRLGFADEEVARWARAAGLEVAAIRHLPPKDGPLTVSLWLAEAAQHAVPRRKLESVR
jgi:DNA-binding transcriptional ArsR family regulator/ubiquinone/menaquinone biosynthesis C-methylase UbiE